MTPVEFFGRILPATGVFFLVLMRDGKTLHKAYASHEELEYAANNFNASPTIQVYFACASYKEPYVVVGDKKRWRIPENHNRAKAFWVDIDVGEDKAATEDGYATKNEAFVAVREFCTAYGLATPLVVDSGGGLHCYWTLTKDISPRAWCAVAERLKMLAAHHGLRADRTRTADLSSILRPVGTHNKKREPREVVVKVLGRDTTPEEFSEAIAKGLRVHNVTPPLVVPAHIANSVNADLLAHKATYPDASAVTAADACSQLAVVRDTQGDVGYYHWFGTIGLIKHCVEGEDLALQWSARREETGHTNTDTRAKYATWTSGPPTCAFFEQHNPSGCAGCPHKDSIKSPIQLGTVVPEPEEQLVEQLVEGEVQTVVVPELPSGYEFRGGKMLRYIKDADGVWHTKEFCTTLFYATHRVVREDNSYGIGLRVHDPRGKVRNFDVPTEVVESKAELLRALAANEVISSTQKDAPMHLTAYLKDSIERLRRESDEMKTLSSFGWKDGMSSFLIGNRLYSSDGSIREVLTAGLAGSKTDTLPAPRGTTQGYADAVNYIYARPGMEPLQYAFCSGFGSILSPLGETLYNGLIVALVSGESGMGKTTVCMAAMYAFGDAERLKLGGPKQGATVNSRYALLGTYQNIPILYDEITKIDPDGYAEFVYQVSTGADKERMQVRQGKGLQFAQKNTWKMSPYVTANDNMMSKLASIQANSQAEAVRMIQINIDQWPTIPKLDKQQVEDAVRQMADNMGSAGALFVSYVVTNLDEVRSTFQKVYTELGLHLTENKFRFYRNHAACTLTAAQVMIKLGIAQFDYTALYDTTLKILRGNATSVGDQNTLTTEDAFYKMVNDLTPRVLVTYDYRDGRSKYGPEEVKSSNQIWVGRYIVGGPTCPTEYVGKMYLMKRPVIDWCAKNRIDFDTLVAFAQEKGAYFGGTERVNITRGTGLPPVQAVCVVFDMSRMTEVTRPKLTVVTTVDGENSAAV